MRHTSSSRFKLCSLLPIICLAVCIGVISCATPQQPPLPLGDLTIGVAPFTQPMVPADMLAGYEPKDAEQVEPKVLSELDALFGQLLLSTTAHSYKDPDAAQDCYEKVYQAGNTPRAAIRTWSAVGRCLGVDLLVVPQLMEWRERDGGEMGVSLPASVAMDFFILDVNNESLVSRSHFDETQAPLTDNLLEAGKFFKRKGKWILAKELAKEGMEKAIKELRL